MEAAGADLGAGDGIGAGGHHWGGSLVDILQPTYPAAPGYSTRDAALHRAHRHHT
jgi:hypothetical protein